MKLVVSLLISVAAAGAGAWAGFDSAKAQINGGDSIFDTFEKTGSGWFFSNDIGSSEATPLERARIAVGGPLGLSSSEVLYFVALNDSAGRRLNSSCTYAVTGAPIDTRWWSLTLYDSDTQNYVRNEANRSSWNSAAIPKDEDGSWQITVSNQSADGNWLPSQSAADQPFELNLRTYNPSDTTRADAPNIALPVVERISC
ncbi:MAG: DUF1214 domain-containing protein [Erythrobacter sp.]